VSKETHASIQTSMSKETDESKESITLLLQRRYDSHIKSDLYTSKETYKRGKCLKRDHLALIVQELRYGNHVKRDRCMYKETYKRRKCVKRDRLTYKETNKRKKCVKRDH